MANNKKTPDKISIKLAKLLKNINDLTNKRITITKAILPPILNLNKIIKTAANKSINPNNLTIIFLKKWSGSDLN